MLPLEGLLHTGYLRAIRARLAGEPVRVRVLASGFDRFFAMWGWKLVSRGVCYATGASVIGPPLLLAAAGVAPWFCASVLAVLASIALVFVVPGLAFGAHLVTFERAGPLRALARSFELTGRSRARIVGLLGTCLALHAVGLAFGAGFFIVGALATVPWTRAWLDGALTRAYFDLVAAERTDLAMRGADDAISTADDRAESEIAEGPDPMIAPLSFEL